MFKLLFSRGRVTIGISGNLIALGRTIRFSSLFQGACRLH